MLVCQKVVALQRTVVATQRRVPEQKSLQDASGLLSIERQNTENGFLTVLCNTENEYMSMGQYLTYRYITIVG